MGETNQEKVETDEPPPSLEENKCRSFWRHKKMQVKIEVVLVKCG